MVISVFILIVIFIVLFLIGQYMVYLDFNNIDVGTKVVVFLDSWNNKYIYDEVIEVNRQYHYIVTKQGYKFYYIDLLRNQFCLEEDFE